MLVFFFNGGLGAQGRWWWVGPLLTFAPLLLTIILPSLGLGSGGQVYVYDSRLGGWRRQDGAGRPSGSGTSAIDPTAAATSLVSSVLVACTSMIATTALTLLLFKLLTAARRDGFCAALRHLLREAFGGGEAAGGQPRGGRQPARTRAQRIEHVARLMQGLPVEVYRTREELEGLSVAQLKALLQKRGVACEQCLEKGDLVAAAAQGGNSTAASCPICCEDYEPGDVMRVLPCGHRYHLECIDRWFLSSTDYSRPTACPFCSKPLDVPAAA